MYEKVEKSRNIVKHVFFFPMFCGSEGSKMKLAKAEPFGRMNVQKVHAAVALSTF